jgi:hypothetical protein
MRLMDLKFFMGFMVLIALASVPAVSALSLSVDDVQISSIGDTSLIDIILDDAPNGLSGYNLTISLSDPEVANIEEMAYPDWAVIHGNSTLPADHVWMKGVDLNNQIESKKGILLGTLTVRGNAIGDSAITVAATAMDDDSGNAMELSPISGTVHVGASSSSNNFLFDLIRQIIAFFKSLFGMTSSTLLTVSW